MATIIIQENDSAVLDVLTMALRLEGHHPIGILGTCPLAMLNTVKRNFPDLVLMDYRNRDNGGTTLLSVVKNLKAKLPVIALSSELNISKIANKLGFDDFIIKPFDLEDLFNTVKRYLISCGTLPHQINPSPAGQTS